MSAQAPTITDAAETNDRLSYTLFLAIAAHAIIIFGFGFAYEKGSQVAPTLNITIATHKGVAPEKADFLAKYNQEGSGTANTVRELSTTEFATIDDNRIKKMNPAPQVRASEERQNTQSVISSKNGQRVTVSHSKQDQDTQKKQQGFEQDIPEQQSEYDSLKAKLDTQQQNLANKPKIRRLTSVATKASHDAEYLSNWAQKIELVGNTNFPQEALDRRIFGKLRLAVMLKKNGVVENVEILNSSGYSILDQAAVQIVKLASPFDPIPPEVAQNNDQLEIIRTWKFEITGMTTGI